MHNQLQWMPTNQPVVKFPHIHFTLFKYVIPFSIPLVFISDFACTRQDFLYFSSPVILRNEIPLIKIKDSGQFGLHIWIPVQNILHDIETLLHVHSEIHLLQDARMLHSITITLKQFTPHTRCNFFFFFLWLLTRLFQNGSHLEYRVHLISRKTDDSYSTDMKMTTFQTKGTTYISCLSRDGNDQLLIFQTHVPTKETSVVIQLPVPFFSLVDVYEEIFRDFRIPFSHLENMDLSEKSQIPWSNISLDVGNGEIRLEKGATHMEGNSKPIGILFPSRKDKRLFIPHGASIVYTINGTNDCGLTPFGQNLNTMFRWDLVDFKFPPMESIRRMSIFTRDSHSLFLPTIDTRDENRLYIGADGCEFHDNTNLGIVRYKMYNLKTLVILNGCYLTRPGELVPYYFGGRKIEFNEHNDYIEMVADGKKFKIYPSQIKTRNVLRSESENPDRLFVEYK